MYAKLKTDGQIQAAPNPLRIVVANPPDDVYEQWGYHKVVEADPPEYDAMTQQVESHYEMQGNDIVQVWTVSEIPADDALDAEDKANAEEITL